MTMNLVISDFMAIMADGELVPIEIRKDKDIVMEWDGQRIVCDRVIFKVVDRSGNFVDYVSVLIASGIVTPSRDEAVCHSAAAVEPQNGDIVALTWLKPDHGKAPGAKAINSGDFDIMTIDDLALDYDTFIANASAGDSATRYPYLVSLLDGDISINGSKFDDDYIEVGEGGTATVIGGKGDDSVWVWHEKDVDFDGGKGSDTIRFEYQVGFDAQPSSGAVVDLAAGTAANPHGGEITLKNVENVVGQFGASNDLRGDDKANRLQGGTLADTLLGLGGNDSIYVKYNATGGARATEADGGTGADTLTAELTYMDPFIGSGFDQKSINRLDLTNQANNTGTFEGGSFENFEVFKVVQDFNTLFYFIGTGNAEKVYGTGYEDDFDGGGGNDLLAGGFAADELTGGEGADRFWFRYATDSNAAGRDTITDFSHAELDRIDLSKIFGGKLDFLGGKNFTGHAGEVRVTSENGDTLVEADISGDKVADFALLLEGGPKVVAADLVL